MISKKGLTWILVYGILVITTVLWFIIDARNKNTNTNCWDNYTTEYEAILNCEE